MHWEIHNRTIQKLYRRGENVILPWGLETADSSAFFSLEEGIGYRHTILEKTFSTTPTKNSAFLRVRMHEGLFDLAVEDTLVSPSRLVRKATLTCLEDSHFMDFVMRFRFLKKFYPKSAIAGKEFVHENTNIYRQYPTDRAEVFGGEERAAIKILSHAMPSSLSPFMYVRDREDEWIVHARMLPTEGAKEVIKLCNAFCQTRPLPKWISAPLLKIPGVKKALWYRPEHAPFTNPILKRINPSAIPIAKVKKGERLSWVVEVLFS